MKEVDELRKQIEIEKQRYKDMLDSKRERMRVCNTDRRCTGLDS